MFSKWGVVVYPVERLRGEEEAYKTLKDYEENIAKIRD